uniref:CUB domain-containing protein n=1 Tax=Globodera pallida TaxID=36090 RepID=A0A183CA72_GLOPA
MVRHPSIVITQLIALAVILPHFRVADRTVATPVLKLSTKFSNCGQVPNCLKYRHLGNFDINPVNSLGSAGCGFLDIKYESVVEELINFQATVSEARAIEAPSYSTAVGSRVSVGGAEANTLRETVHIEIGIAGSAMDLDIGSECVSRTRHGFGGMESRRPKSQRTPFGLEE